VFNSLFRYSVVLRFLLLVPASVFGIAGYVAANSQLRKRGRAPWGWPPIVWGLVYFVSLLLGAVLMSIASGGEVQAMGRSNALVGIRSRWLLRAAMMIIGFLLGTVLLLAGVAIVIGGGSDRVVAAIVALVGATLLAGGMKAAQAQRRSATSP
jgi:hypothetical protein